MATLEQGKDTMINFIIKEVAQPIIRRVGTAFATFTVGLGIPTEMVQHVNSLGGPDEAQHLIANVAVLVIGIYMDLVLSHSNRSSLIDKIKSEIKPARKARKPQVKRAPEVS